MMRRAVIDEPFSEAVCSLLTSLFPSHKKDPEREVIVCYRKIDIRM
jgi:hypothetical protein